MVLGKAAIKLKFPHHRKLKLNICVPDGKKKEIGYLLEPWPKRHWIPAEKRVPGSAINSPKSS